MSKLFITNVANSRRDYDDNVVPLDLPEPLIGEPCFPSFRSRPASRLEMMAEAMGHELSDEGYQFEQDDFEDDGEAPQGEPLGLPGWED